jgi:transposase, IS30 family
MIPPELPAAPPAPDPSPRTYRTYRTYRTQDQLDAIARKLNTRPRRALGYATPAEAINDFLVATTT